MGTSIYRLLKCENELSNSILFYLKKIKKNRKKTLIEIGQKLGQKEEQKLRFKKKITQNMFFRKSYFFFFFMNDLWE